MQGYLPCGIDGTVQVQEVSQVQELPQVQELESMVVPVPAPQEGYLSRL